MHIGALMQDVLRELGHLTLGSRLRRVGERLQSVTQNYLSGVGHSIPAPQLPILAALDRLGALTVGDLSQALRVTQPGVTRMVAKLQKAGLVSSTRVAGDQRVRKISLSAKGQRVVDTSKRSVWPVIDALLKEQCTQLSGSLLDQLAQLEDMLTPDFFETNLPRALGADHDDPST